MRAPIECLFAAPHLQGVAGRCSVLHSVAVCCSVQVDICRVTNKGVAMCCSVLWCVAGCCCVEFAASRGVL